MRKDQVEHDGATEPQIEKAQMVTVVAICLSSLATVAWSDLRKRET